MSIDSHEALILLRSSCSCPENRRLTDILDLYSLVLINFTISYAGSTPFAPPLIHLRRLYFDKAKEVTICNRKRYSCTSS